MNYELKIKTLISLVLLKLNPKIVKMYYLVNLILMAIDYFTVLTLVQREEELFCM